MRGIVFRDDQRRMVLLTVSDDLKVEEKILESGADDDFEEMPDEAGEIVEILEDNPTIKVVEMRPICSMRFTRLNDPCPARDAIRYSARHSPDRLYEALEQAVHLNEGDHEDL